MRRCWRRLPLIFRRSGENPVPVFHPTGLMDYYGEKPLPADCPVSRMDGQADRETSTVSQSGGGTPFGVG